VKDLKVKTQKGKKNAVIRANDREQGSLNSLGKNSTELLLKTLNSLQKQSMRVDQDNKRANASLYNHLVNAYLWWRKARKVEGFIEAEFDKLDLRKSSGQANPNFIPVLRIICGKDSSLKDQEFQRRSRALNAIHIEFEKNPEKYKSGGIAKLVNFIELKGGVSELAGYRHSEKVPAEKHENNAETKQRVEEEAASRTVVIEAAVNAASQRDSSTILVSDDFPEYISTNDQDCFLLLVQKTDDGYEVVGRSCDHELIDSVLVKDHRKRFEAHASVVRPLLELIQTQCYPKYLQSVSKKLIDTSKLDEFEQKTFKSYRRVMFRHDTQQFMLSPINAYSGVVSLITPNQQMLGKCATDLYMPLSQRSALEKELLQDFDFNLYDASEIEQFPASDSDSSTTHELKLVHRAISEKKVDVRFLQFDGSLQKPFDQVGLNPDYLFKAQWQAALPHCYFQKLADQFLNPWLDGLGKHIGRNYNSLIRVSFGNRSIDIDFTYKEGKFEAKQSVEYIKKGGSKKCSSSLFLSKDWLLAFRSIALLPVDGDVSLAINNDVLRIDFATKEDSGARHEIHIPTVDIEGNRSTAPFVRYEPEINVLMADNSKTIKGEARV